MRFRSLPHLVVASLLTAFVAACSTSPAAPTPPAVTPPPVVPAPVISALSATATRVEAGQEVTVTATVDDAAPALGAVTYEWSANVGRVTGTGASAVWRLDKGTISTGADVIVSLTVVKPYQALENGQVVSREHRVTRQAAAFRVHDSAAEISRIVLTFLVDYFGKFEVSPDACMVDFSPGCPGTALEREDVIKNRRERRIISVDARIGGIEINGTGTFAWIDAPCTFRDTDLAGVPHTTSGVCVLSAIYENNRWWLCSSNYNPDGKDSTPSMSREPVRRGMRYWE